MNKNIVVLENLLYDSPELGNKVKNTAILSREGIRVPRSIGLKYDMYVEQMKDMIPHIKDIIVKTDDYSVMAEEIYDLSLMKVSNMRRMSQMRLWNTCLMQSILPCVLLGHLL